MAGNKNSGDQGELEVIERVECPNCGKKLQLLPPGFPLVDVQCTGCSFRAQIKSPRCPPRSTMGGAGFDVFRKVLKSGYLAPPLILNFRWPRPRAKHRVILYYPFIPSVAIKGYQLSDTARHPGYKMFSYLYLNRLPHFVLHEENEGDYPEDWCGVPVPKKTRRRKKK